MIAAAGKLAGETVSVLQPGMNVKLWVAGQLFASTTLTTNVAFAVEVGTPLMTPEALSDKPVGSAPEARLQATSPVAPVTVSCWL